MVFIYILYLIGHYVLAGPFTFKIIKFKTFHRALKTKTSKYDVCPFPTIPEKIKMWLLVLHFKLNECKRSFSYAAFWKTFYLMLTAREGMWPEEQRWRCQHQIHTQRFLEGDNIIVWLGSASELRKPVARALFESK